MKPREIQSGCYYLNESKELVREIVAVRDDGYVQYFSYWLSDGVSDGILGVYQDRTLAKWASREATTQEVARLKHSEARERGDDPDRLLLQRLTETMASGQGDDPFRAYFPDGFTIRDEANSLVAWAFRNDPLEGLHVSKHSELLQDPSLSRITDEEMKALMTTACRQLAKLFELKAIDLADYERQVKSYKWRYYRGWER